MWLRLLFIRIKRKKKCLSCNTVLLQKVVCAAETTPFTSEEKPLCSILRGKCCFHFRIKKIPKFALVLYYVLRLTFEMFTYQDKERARCPPPSLHRLHLYPQWDQSNSEIAFYFMPEGCLSNFQCQVRGHLMTMWTHFFWLRTYIHLDIFNTARKQKFFLTPPTSSFHIVIIPKMKNRKNISWKSKNDFKNSLTLLCIVWSHIKSRKLSNDTAYY